MAELEYGGAGQSSETVELFRDSEMAKLAGARRRRNLLRLGDSGAGKDSKMTEAGQGSETAELVRAGRRRSCPGARRRWSWSVARRRRS